MLDPWSWLRSYEELYCSSIGQCTNRPITRHSLVCQSILTCILLKLVDFVKSTVEVCCLSILMYLNLKLGAEGRPFMSYLLYLALYRTIQVFILDNSL